MGTALSCVSAIKLRRCINELPLVPFMIMGRVTYVHHYVRLFIIITDA
jgi:hypothetical protein